MNRLFIVAVAGLMVTSVLSPFSVLSAQAKAMSVKRGDFTVTGVPSGSSFKNNVLTISGSGSYTISGNGGYTDDRIVVTSPKMPTIKLKNIRINTSGNKPAIEINGRKGADFRIEGNNYTKAVNRGLSYTGNETLKLSGSGSLKTDITGGIGVSGIYASNGKLEIKSGTIISNAPIIAREMKISGGSLNASLGNTVLRNAQNQRVYKQTITIDGEKNKAISKIKVKNVEGKIYHYAHKGMKTDENAQMNVYLPDNTAVVSANVGKTLYSLDNTAKAALGIVENNSLNENSNVLTGTTAPIVEKLADADNLSNRIEAVTVGPDKSYTLMSESGLKNWMLPAQLPPARGEDAPYSTIHIDVKTSGTAASAKEASIKVNGKAEIMVIEKDAGGNNMMYDEFKSKFTTFETEMITNPDTGKEIRKYDNANFLYKWENGDPSVANLQLPDGGKTLAVGLKPGKTLIRCDISAEYKEREFVKEAVPNTNPVQYKYVLKDKTEVKKNFAAIYLTLFVMPDLINVKLDPPSASIVVGGSLGESTAFLKADVQGLTVSTPNEKTKVTLNNVQYLWREVLPKEPEAGQPNDFLDIMYDGKNIDYKDDKTEYNKPGEIINGFPIDRTKGLPYAKEVNVVAKKEAKNIKVGLTVYLKYTYKSKFYKNDGSFEDKDITVETALPEVFTVVNIDDKGGITVDKSVLNLSINGKNPQSVDTVTAKMSGADTSLVYFKWWEYSGPSKTSFVDFSNKKGIVAEPDNDDLKTLPIWNDDKNVYKQNKEKMKGSDGATITVQALEAGTTYLYVQGTYINPDTKTSYTKETVVKVIIKDNSDNGSGGSGGSGGSDGSGGSGGSGGNNGQQNGNGDLTVSELPNVSYNTKAHTPNFTVKSGINQLRRGIDYEFTFIDNIEAGTATLMINGKNQYDGYWAKKTFKIAKADLVIKNPVLAVNTLKASNYTYDLSMLLPPTGMTPTDRANTVYKLGKSSLPKTNFSNITNGGNTSILSFDAKGITTAGTQGIIELTIESSPNFNKASVQLTVKSDSGMKVSFNPKNGQDAFTINVEPGAKINTPDVPKKDNATFTGWYRADGKQWDFDKDLVSSSMELYAGWRDGKDMGTPETLNYNSNDGKISQTFLDRAVAEHRDLKVNVVDAKGDIVSQWLFDADKIGGVPAGSFDLNTDIYDAEESPAFNLLKEDINGMKGIGISIGAGGAMPVGAMVKVKAPDNLGGRKGRDLYLYKYNPDTHKLLTLPRRSKIKVDTDGYAKIPVIESGDYILAVKRPKSKNIVTLNKQINVNKIKNANVGSSKKINLSASPTLKRVSNLKQDMPYYYGAYNAKFSSSNKKVAKVSGGGNIKFLKKGTVKIYTDIELYNGTKTRKTMTIKVK